MYSSNEIDMLQIGTPPLCFRSILCWNEFFIVIHYSLLCLHDSFIWNIYFFPGIFVNRWCTACVPHCSNATVVLLCNIAHASNAFYRFIFNLFLSFAFMFRRNISFMYFVRFNFRQFNLNKWCVRAVRERKRYFYISILIYRRLNDIIVKSSSFRVHSFDPFVHMHTHCWSFFHTLNRFQQKKIHFISFPPVICLHFSFIFF